MLGGTIAALTAALLGSLWPTFQSAAGPVIQEGDQAPEFALTSDAGRPIQLQDFAGKFLVLNFWATWCPPCLEELPSLNRFHIRYAPQGVVVLGVSVDEDRKAYQDLVEHAGVSFPTVRDPERKVSRLYGTFKYPETYVISPQGRVVRKIIGPRDWGDSTIVEMMESLLKG